LIFQAFRIHFMTDDFPAVVSSGTRPTEDFSSTLSKLSYLEIINQEKHHSNVARPTAHDPLKTGSPAERACGISPKSNIRGHQSEVSPLHLKSSPAILRMQALTPIKQPNVKAQAYGRFRYKLRKSS
jgi:hypothetical protein